MPELPEVETIVRDLDNKITGKKVISVIVLDKKVVGQGAKQFGGQVVNQIVKAVKRRAKIIIIELPSKFILIHLKMTGQLVYQWCKTKSNVCSVKNIKLIAGGHPIKGMGQELPNKFTRFIFKFNDGSKLYFNDVRKFGWVKLANRQELDKIFGKLGVEPLTKEFTLAKFKEILLHKQKTTIKQAIMDQQYLSGLGNIYSDEALYQAGIKPMRIVRTLTNDDIKKLWRAIPKILLYSIKHRGTSFSDYVDVQGEVGNFIKYLKVYGRAGEKCKHCVGVVRKTKLAGRGAHWCEKCQK